jgi:hypothetical protein
MLSVGASLVAARAGKYGPKLNPDDVMPHFCLFCFFLSVWEIHAGDDQYYVWSKTDRSR